MNHRLWLIGYEWTHDNRLKLNANHWKGIFIEDRSNSNEHLLCSIESSWTTWSFKIRFNPIKILWRWRKVLTFKDHVGIQQLLGLIWTVPRKSEPNYKTRKGTFWDLFHQIYGVMESLTVHLVMTKTLLIVWAVEIPVQLHLISNLIRITWMTLFMSDCILLIQWGRLSNSPCDRPLNFF